MLPDYSVNHVPGLYRLSPNSGMWQPECRKCRCVSYSSERALRSQCPVLGGGASLRCLNRLRDIIRCGAQAHECPHEEIEGDRRITRFHFRDARLTGAEALRYCLLREAQLDATGAQRIAEPELQLDDRRFCWRQFEKVGGRADPPAVRFEDLLFCLSHHYLPPRA